MLCISQSRVLRAIQAVCAALFVAIGASPAKATVTYSGEYTVNGMTVNPTIVTAAGINTTSAYFYDTSSKSYSITVASGSDLGNTTGQANGDEIQFGNGTVTNAGTLNATDSGVYLDRPDVASAVINTGSITGIDDAGILADCVANGYSIQAFGFQVTNSGTISSTLSNAIQTTVENENNAASSSNSNTETLLNTGTITGDDSAIDVVLLGNAVNAGTSNANSLTITNSSTMTGTTAQGVLVDVIDNFENTGNGPNTNAVVVTNSSGATITAGQSALEIVEVYNEDNTNSTSNSNTVAISNAGILTANGGDGIELENLFNDENTGSAFSDSNAVTITNSGTVTATGQGIYVNASNAANTGSSIDGNSISFSNSGTVTSTAGSGVDLAALNSTTSSNASNAVTVNNSGTITALDYGVYVENENETVAGNSTQSIALTNSGAITGTNEDAVRLINLESAITGAKADTITVNNTSTGSMVSADGAGLYIDNPLTSSADTVSVNNAGTITGTTYGIDLNSNFGTVVTTGGSITGPSDAIDLAGNNSSVTVQGRTNISGTIQGNDNAGNSLTFNLAGITPAQIAAAQTAIANAGTGPGTFQASGLTYNFDGFPTVNFHAVSFEQSVDSGLRNLATALDNTGGTLPVGYNQIFDQGFSNPEATLNSLSGREFLDAFTQVGLNTATAFAQAADTRSNNLRAGSSGLEFSGLNATPRTMIASLGDTENTLNRMAGPSILGMHTISDSSDRSSMVQTPYVRKWGFWVAGTVTFADESGSPAIPSYNATSGSPTIGADYRVSRDLVLGALFNYTTAGVNFGDGSTLNSDTYLGGLYADWTHGHWYVNGLAGGGYNSYSQNRNTLSGATATASPGGGEALVAATAGYDFKAYGWIFSPEFGLQYTHLNKNSFTESGAGAYDLSVGSQNVDSLRTKLGIDIVRPFTLLGIKYVPQINAYWYHECLDETNGVSNSLPGAPALGSFVVDTNPEGNDFALLGAGLSATPASWDGNVSFFANYAAQVGQTDFMSNTVDGGVRIGF